MNIAVFLTYHPFLESRKDSITHRKMRQRTWHLPCRDDCICILHVWSPLLRPFRGFSLPFTPEVQTPAPPGSQHSLLCRPALRFTLPYCEHVFLLDIYSLSGFFFNSQTKINQAVGDEGQTLNSSTISNDWLKHSLTPGVFDWCCKSCSSQSCKTGWSGKRAFFLFLWNWASFWGWCLHHSNYLPAPLSLNDSVLGIKLNTPHMLGKHPYLWATPKVLLPTS